MKNINSCTLSGTIFWSKLDEKPTYSILRLGLKLGDGNSVFCIINNPRTKEYNIVKTGNKVFITNAWFDTWYKDDKTAEPQLKAYGYAVQFFAKEVGISNFNSFSILGKVVAEKPGYVVVEMEGDRNPKTEKRPKRRITVKIPEDMPSLSSKEVFINGEITCETLEGGKTKMLPQATYDKILVI